MKLTSVEVHPDKSADIAVLGFRDPRNENSYNVKDIVGLAADDIVPQYYGSYGNSKFYNLSLSSREIVVKVGLNPNFENDESYSSLRDGLYKMISSSRTGKVQLQFKNDTDIIAGISGYVSKFEALHFEKAPEVQFTIRCDDPMLKALAPYEINPDEFKTDNMKITDNKSTAPHGFDFELTFSAAVATLSLFDPNDPSWTFDVTPTVSASGFQIGDVLYFSSDYTRELYIERSTDIIYIAHGIVPGSMWPLLFPGENTFSFNVPTSVAFRKISYYPTYWGV